MSDKTRGEVLFKIFEEIIIREGLEWKTNLIGQSYDGRVICLVNIMVYKLTSKKK